MPILSPAIFSKTGRNILPVGSQNFTTGWSWQNGAAGTITGGQADPFGGNNAYRILSTTPGSSVVKYKCSMAVSELGKTYKEAVWLKVNAGSVKVGCGDSQTTLISSNAWQQVKVSFTGNGESSTSLFLLTSLAGDNLDITVIRPQQNFTRLCSFSLPAGLP